MNQSNSKRRGSVGKKVMQKFQKKQPSRLRTGSEISMMSSFSSMSQKDKDIKPDIARSKDNLMAYAIEAKKKLDTIINNSKTVTSVDTDKIYNIRAHIGLDKDLLARCQLGLYDSTFLTQSIHMVEAIHVNKNELKKDARQYSVQNKELKIKLTYMINRLIELERSQASATEEVKYWELLVAISKTIGTSGTDLVDIMEKEIWNEAISATERAPVLPPLLQEVEMHMDEGNTKEAKRIMQDFLDKKKGISEHYVGLLVLLAKRCSDDGMNEEGLGIIETALKLREEQYGAAHPAVILTIIAQALLRAKNSEFDLAAKDALKATQDLGKLYGKGDLHQTVGNLYYRVGFMIAMWGYHEDGVKLIESALVLFDSMLPKSEISWMRAVIGMATVCNNRHHHDDAIAVLCELIDYFHEKVYGPVNKKNRTIYDLANEVQKSEANKAKLLSMSTPSPVSIPPLVQNTLKELILGYASKYEFGAAKTVETYLNECMKVTVKDQIYTGFTEEGDQNKYTPTEQSKKRLERYKLKKPA